MGIFFTSQNLCEWERLTLNSNVYFCTLNNIMPNQNIRVYYNRNSAKLDLIHEVISIVRNHVIPALYSNTDVYKRQVEWNPWAPVTSPALAC